MLRNNFEVQVLVKGSPVKEYAKDGKVYIEGKKDSKYALKIINRSFKRILAVITVDGLSVIDGKLGSFKSRGYIIDGYSSETIYGWRKDGETTADFFFSDINNSYAEKVDKGGHQGIVGVAIFYEKDNGTWSNISTTVYPKTTYYYPWGDTVTTTGSRTVYNFTGSTDNLMSNTTNTSAINYMASDPSNVSNACSSSIATGWGDERSSHASPVQFSKEDDPAAIFEIYYNTREELEKLGINFEKKPIYVNEPVAFPGEYCQPPKK
jgi:hypothetical protein